MGLYPGDAVMPRGSIISGAARHRDVSTTATIPAGVELEEKRAYSHGPAPGHPPRLQNFSRCPRRSASKRSTPNPFAEPIEHYVTWSPLCGLDHPTAAKLS